MRTVDLITTVVIATIPLTACTVYKSNDRDYFNANAIAGAPARAATKPLEQSCAVGSISELVALGMNFADRDDDLSIAPGKQANTIAITAAQLTTDNKRAAACTLTFTDNGLSEDLTTVARIHLQSYIQNLSVLEHP